MKFFNQHKYFITGLLAVVAVSLLLPLLIPQPYAMLLSMGFGLYAGRTAARLKHESENQ